MSVDAGLKHLKVISRGEDGGRELSLSYRPLDTTMTFVRLYNEIQVQLICRRICLQNNTKNNHLQGLSEKMRGPGHLIFLRLSKF